MAGSESSIHSAEVVLPCGSKLNETLSFFTDRLGFRLNLIYPADSPRVAVISAHGVCLRLEQTPHEPKEPITLRLHCTAPQTIAEGTTRFIAAPNGSRIELLDVNAPLQIPQIKQSFVLQRNDGGWTNGRAGMLYRDLIPDRQGGRFVASHIRILDGGAVSDYVHYHKVRFQMIYCFKGWVKVVYEDQGPPMMVHQGDCILQPPEIRHRVLESSQGLEVIEIGCPSEIVTYADHNLTLPNATVDPNRKFKGQVFVHHQAASAKWRAWKSSGFEYRDLGIGLATNGLAGVRVVRLISSDVGESHGLQNGSGDLVNGSHDYHKESHDFCKATHDYNHDGEFLFLFILKGEANLSSPDKKEERLGEGDSCVVPAQFRVTVSAVSADLEFLEVTLPASE